MNIFNIFKRSSNATVQEPEQPLTYTPATGYLFGDVAVSAYGSLNVSPLYAAVELISNSIAQLPILVKEITNGQQKICPDHQLNTALRTGLFSKYTIFKQAISDMLLWGNGYIYIDRNEDGSPRELRYVQHSDVSILYNKFKHTVLYNIPIISKKMVEPCDLLHFYKNSADGINGKGILLFGSKALEIAKYTESSANNFFKKGCAISGILSIKGNIAGQTREQIMNDWQQVHGAGKSGLAVLKGDMEYQPVSMNGRDSQMLESRLFSVQEVARFFNINPVLLGDLSKSSYNTIEAAQLEFLTHTLLPIITLVEDELNRKVLRPSERGKYIIDVDEAYLLKTDKTSEAQYVTTLVEKGILTRNEARSIIGFGRMDGCDDLIIPYTNIEQNTINKKSEDITDEERV